MNRNQRYFRGRRNSQQQRYNNNSQRRNNYKRQNNNQHNFNSFNSNNNLNNNYNNYNNNNNNDNNFNDNEINDYNEIYQNFDDENEYINDENDFINVSNPNNNYQQNQHHQQNQNNGNNQNEETKKDSYQQFREYHQSTKQHEEKCDYCNSTIGLIKCECGRIFCNGRIENQNTCQLFQHLRESGHFSVSIQGTKLTCKTCGQTNIYQLQYSNTTKELRCEDCLLKASQEEKDRFTEKMFCEGKLKVSDKFNIGLSDGIVPLDVVLEKEKKYPKEQIEKRVRMNYKKIKEYTQLYKYLLRIEKKEEVKVIEEEIHVNDKLKKLRHKKEVGKSACIDIKLDKVIGGLYQGTRTVICCVGDKNIVRDEDADYLYSNAVNIFRTAKNVLVGKVTSVAKTRIRVDINENFFFDEDSEKKYPTRDYNKWTYNERIMNETRLFRIFFLTTEKPDPFSRTLDVFEDRRINQYYNKILCNYSCHIDPQRLQFTYNDIVGNDSLNDCQRKAVLNSLNNEISLIVGPPGTGKTTVAISIVKNLLKHKEELIEIDLLRRRDEVDPSLKRILVCASSNNAVDVVCRRLLNENINTVRIISEEQFMLVSDEIREKSLLKKALDYCVKNKIKSVEMKKVNLKKDKKGKQNEEIDDDSEDELSQDENDFETMEQYKQYKEEHNSVLIEIQNLLKKKYNTALNKKEQKQLENEMKIFESNPLIKLKYRDDFEMYVKKEKQDLYKLIKKQRNRISKEENEYIKEFISDHFDEILEGVDCVCATLTICTGQQVLKQKFFASIIDEAAQSLETETLAGMINVRRAVLIGDIQQLQPTVISPICIEAGFKISMFERLMSFKIIPRTMLRVQYRMHPSLSEFSNDAFYSGKLIDGVSKKDRYDNRLKGFFPNKHHPMVFVQCDGKEDIGTSGKSYKNEGEALIVKQIAEHLLSIGIRPEEIGIISPYQEQQLLLIRNITKQIQVANIDGFQGNEKEYIIFSCVRSNEKSGVGFVKDYKRLNVALTRAKKGIIIVGNLFTLRKSDVWNMLLNHFNEQKCIFKWKMEQITEIENVGGKRVQKTKEVGKFVNHYMGLLLFHHSKENSNYQVSYCLDDLDYQLMEMELERIEQIVDNLKVVKDKKENQRIQFEKEETERIKRINDQEINRMMNIQNQLKKVIDDRIEKEKKRIEKIQKILIHNYKVKMQQIEYEIKNQKNQYVDYYSIQRTKQKEKARIESIQDKMIIEQRRKEEQRRREEEERRRLEEERRREEQRRREIAEEERRVREDPELQKLLKRLAELRRRQKAIVEELGYVPN